MVPILNTHIIYFFCIKINSLYVFYSHTKKQIVNAFKCAATHASTLVKVNQDTINTSFIEKHDSIAYAMILQWSVNMIISVNLFSQAPT